MGEKWAVLGSNGSGKSTLALMVAAQVWPTEGEVKWTQNDTEIDPQKVFSFVSLASPAMELQEEFTLNEIIEMHGRIKPFSSPNALEEIAELCKFDSVTCNKEVGNYSSGMLQRVKLCLAAFTDTPVLILDEPLSNLDGAGHELFEQILENFTQNRLLLIASNNEAEYRSCNRYLRLLAGGSVVVD